MSKRKRWEPPHPPKIVGRTKEQAQAEARAAEKKQQERQFHRLDIMRAEGKQVHDPCFWPRCPRRVAEDLGLPLCTAHARVVHDRVCEDLDNHSRRDEARRRAYEETVCKIERGETIPDPGWDSTTPGWIYYLRIGDLIKIGYAKDVWSRLKAYPPNAQLLAVEPGTMKVERERHSRFTEHLARGREWFAPNPALDAWILDRQERYAVGGHEIEHQTPDTTPRETTRYVGTKHWSGIKKTAG